MFAAQSRTSPGKGSRSRRCHRAAIFIVLALSVTTSGAPSGPSSQRIQAGDNFKDVRSEFESELRVVRAADLGDEKGFNVDDVNGILTRTAEKLISKVPADDTPLIQYIQTRIPRPVDNNKVFVEKSDAESRFAVVSNMLEKLGKLSSFRLDLTITTNPSKARFDLIPAIGTSLSAATNTTLANVYRGEYRYSVTKAGYKDILGTVNFIDRSGTTLQCDLLSDSTQQEALPCNLK
jgi:hypothetical protein